MNDQPPPVDSVRRAQQVDATCDQAEAAWQAGQRPRLEELLAGVAAAAQETLLGELLCLEVYYRRQLGETPTPEEYRARFPQAPNQIDQAFASCSEPRRSQLQRVADQKLSERSSLNIKLAETLPFVAGQVQHVGGSLPEMFGRYKIVKALGRGAMGVVYLARDTQLERNVALKVPQLNGPGQEEMIERFYREARAAAALRHPHICPVFDVGKIDGQHFISMAYVEGNPLSKFINPQKPPKSTAAAALIRKVALGLQEAHEHGIVHRDLKPGNIMVDARGEPTVMDFGLARDFSQKDATKVTQTGMLIGTPAYMSPEQIEGDQSLIGPATDIWSLGVILYELLSGQLPFPGGTIFKVISNIQQLEPKRLRELRPDIPPQLGAICHKMMAKEIAQRYQSMAEVAAVLAQIGKLSPAAASAAAAEATPSVQPATSPANVDAQATANDPPVAETITLLKQTAVTPAQPISAVQQIVADITRLPHWRIVLGAAAAVWLFVAMFLVYVFSGSPQPEIAAPPLPKPGNNAPAKPNAKTEPGSILPNLMKNPPAASGERRLFNGQDLTGWVPLPAERAQNKAALNWEVDAQNGILRSKGLDQIDLTTTEKFRDFYLRCEWRGVPGWEAKVQFTPGILIRCDGTHLGGPRGIEIDFNEGVKSPRYGTGCLLAFDTPLTNHEGSGTAMASHVAYGRLKAPVLVPHPGWNRVEIRNLRDRLSVWINDELVNEGWNIPARAGTIVLRDQQSACEFRNIRLSPLESTESVPAIAESSSATKAEMFTRLRPLTGHRGAVPTVAITADGSFGFSGGGFPDGDHVVRKWDLATGQQVFAFEGHTGMVEGVACDAAGKRLLTSSRDGTVRLLDGLQGESQAVFRDHRAEVVKAAVSPDGRWGATSSDDRSLRLWDLESRQPHGILFGAESPTTCIAISADSRLVAAGSYDAEIVIGELATCGVVRRLNGGPCLGIAFSRDGKWLATCQPQGFVLVFEVESGRLWQRLKVSSPTAVQFLPDNDHILVTAGNTSLFCLNHRTGLGDAGQRLGMGTIKQMAYATAKPLWILSGNQLPNAPQLQVSEVGELPADLPISYLSPAPGEQATPREVVDWILRIGGRLRLPGSTQLIKSASELPPGNWKVDWLSLERCALLPGEIKCLNKLLPLTKLEIGSTTLNDEEMQSLQPAMSQVMDLKVGRNPISDRTLQLLAANRGLGQLDVELTAVTDTALASLIAQNRIRLMALDSRQLTARLRPALQTAPRLQFLVLVSVPEQPADLAHLKNTEPNGLALLGLNSPHGLHPAPDFSVLVGAGNLTTLRLQNFDLSTQAVQQLVQLRQLQTLTITRCQISTADVARLEAALPQCQIKIAK